MDKVWDWGRELDRRLNCMTNDEGGWAEISVTGNKYVHNTTTLRNGQASFSDLRMKEPTASIVFPAYLWPLYPSNL